MILLGLDGGTFRLLEHYIKSGVMPNLAGMRDGGAWGVLNSTFPPTTPPAWSSCMTGTNPGRHGIFDFREPYHKDPTRALISSYSIRSAKIWHYLEKSNKTSILLNVPLTYPPERINGCAISGLMTPSEDVDYTYPKELRSELIKAVGRYIVNIDIPQYDIEHPDDAKRFFDELDDMTQLRARAFEWLLSEKRWDFFMAVFVFSDRIQHLFWKVIDPELDFQRPDAEAIRERTEKLFCEFDEFLGRLIKSLDDDTTLFLISDHGFGSTETWFNANTWLSKLGYLKLETAQFFKKRAFALAVNLAESRFGKSVIPRGFTRKARMRVRSKRSTFKTDLPYSLDMNRTKAFFAGIPSQGIFVTQKADERERVKKELKEKILELKLPDGSQAADEVWFAEEIYSGPETEFAPDIVFVLKNFSVLARPILGDWKVFRASANSPNGFHRKDGIFFAYGKSVKPAKLEQLEMVDVMPTVLYAMGEKVPKDLDGRVKTEIFNSPSSVEFCESIVPPYLDEEAFSEDEQAEIKRRLSGLGYF